MRHLNRVKLATKIGVQRRAISGKRASKIRLKSVIVKSLVDHFQVVMSDFLGVFILVRVNFFTFCSLTTRPGPVRAAKPDE